MSARAVVVPLLWAVAFGAAGYFFGYHVLAYKMTLVDNPTAPAAGWSTAAVSALIGLAIGRADARR